MLSFARRRFLDGLDRRYIYGRVVCINYVSPHHGDLERLGIHQLFYFLPQNTGSQYTDYVLLSSNLQPLLHAIIFLIEMVIAARLAAKFNSYYAERPGKMTARL